MSRHFKCNSALIDASTEWLCEIGGGEIPLWCLEFSLLQKSQVEALTITFADKHSLTLAVNPAMRPGEKAELRRVDDKFSIMLAENQLDYLLGVLLRAYRDGCAEVSHVHIEGACSGCNIDLTLLFSCYQKPLTPKQVAKQLR